MRNESTRKIFRLLVLTIALFGFGKTIVFAQNGMNGDVQKGLAAQNMGNYGDAFQYFQSAADRGNAEGQYHLGYLYLSGQGVTADVDQAVKWFRMGADQGDARCEYYLGSCYENGWGVSKDIDEAKKWYQSASQQGFQGAENSLNRLNGSPSVPAENENAAPVPNSVAPPEANDSDAWVKQGYAEFNKKNFIDAINIFKKAALAGNMDGEVGMASCYFVFTIDRKNPDRPKYFDKAIKCLEKAAAADNPTGLGMLGGAYKDGIGVKKDLKKAKQLFEKAAALGNEKAKEALSQM